MASGTTPAGIDATVAMIGGGHMRQRDQDNAIRTSVETAYTVLGEDLYCAMCHDHPFNDYTQRSFYEMAAFFGSTDIPGKNVRAAPKVLKNRYHRVTNAPDDFLTLPDDYKYDDAKPGSQVTPVRQAVSASWQTPAAVQVPVGAHMVGRVSSQMTEPGPAQQSASVAQRTHSRCIAPAHTPALQTSPAVQGSLSSHSAPSGWPSRQRPRGGVVRPQAGPEASGAGPRSAGAGAAGAPQLVRVRASRAAAILMR